MIPADSTVLVTPYGKAVNPGSGDVDLTVLFNEQPFARGLYNGSSAAANIAVVFVGDPTATAVTYQNVQPGAHIYGIFKTLKQTNTTATNIVAEQ